MSAASTQTPVNSSVASKGDAVFASVDTATGAAEAAATPCTDLGNAERLAKMTAGRLAHCHGMGWLTFENGRWKRDIEYRAIALAKDMVRSLYWEAGLIPDEGSRKTMAAWARRSEASPRIKAALELARAEPALVVTADQLDANPAILNCTNGILDLRDDGTVELLEHDPAARCMSQAPASYDPEAVAPRWRQFLGQVVPEEETRRFLQKAVGYSITGSVSEQILFFLHGEGANGKSTFLGVLRDCFGDYAMEAAPELLVARQNRGVPTDVADLRGRRFVTTVEVEDGRRMAEGLVKQLTGERILKARYMRQDFFEFENRSKIWLAANHKPEVKGTDYAIWRRILLVPFDVTIPESNRDPELHDKLVAEQDGILAWAAEGYRLYREEGLAPPSEVRAATEGYREEMDPIKEWLEDCCEEDDEGWEANSDLRASYEKYARCSGQDPITGVELGRRLGPRGFKGKRSGGVRGWQGLRLRDEEKAALTATSRMGF